MKTWVVLAAAMFLTACASDMTTGGGPATSSATSSPSSSPSSSAPAASDPSPPNPDAAVPCEETMFERAKGTIRSQQSALGQRDFEAARSYSSQAFQSMVSIDEFRMVIEGGYAFLFNDPDLDFLECERRGESALVTVNILGSPTVRMAYRMILENESWFIDGAVVAGSREEVTT